MLNTMADTKCQVIHPLIPRKIKCKVDNRTIINCIEDCIRQQEAKVLETIKRTDKTAISPEKQKEVKVHWTISNQPSQKALESFNRVLAKAQLRVYREFLETK